jgi:hypothetical protein
MKRHFLSIPTLLIAGLIWPLMMGSAHAQATRIFVASYGNDANDGSRGAPKRNFQPAHDAVAAGGQIVVLDTAGYGTLTINKSVAVTVPPGVNGFVTATGSASGIVISATANDKVSLRGLIVEGVSTGSNSGIRIAIADSVIIEDCTVRNFDRGVTVSPGASHTILRHCVVRGCGDRGVNVQPLAGDDVIVTLSDCRLEQNANWGLLAQTVTTGGGSSADVTLTNCFITGNLNPISAFNPFCVVRASDCVIVENTSAPSASGGGQVLSRVNNTLEFNDNGNTFPGTYNAK